MYKRQVERFIGVLIEHFAGAFPLWLSPVQAVVLPIADRHADRAHEIEAELKKYGIRVKAVSYTHLSSFIIHHSSFILIYGR